MPNKIELNQRDPATGRFLPKPKAVAVNGNGNGAAHTYQVPARRGLTQIVSSQGSLFGVYGLKFAPTPYNPDSLVQRKGIKIYREMAIDEQAKAALFAKKYAVLSTGYEVQTPETPQGATQTEVDEHKDFIEFNFEEMEGSFESKLLDILSALVFGFSVSEKLFQKIDGGPFDGLWGLHDLKTRPPDDIQFATDSAGDLLPDGVWQNLVRLPADKFVIFSYAKEFGGWYGNSDLRSAYRAFWCKQNVMKQMAVTLERYAEPIATATVTGTIDEEVRSDLEQFLKNLQSRSGIILPDNVVLDFKTPSDKAATSYIPALNYYDSLIRTSILMPGLIGMSANTTPEGSYARASTEFDTFLWVLNQLRRDLETCVNEQIIKPLIDLNYEVDYGQYPKFKFREVTEEAKQRQFELFLMGLSGGGLNKGPEDENKLRELINFEPLPEDFVPPPSPEDLKMQLMLAGAGMGTPPNGGSAPNPPNGGNGNGAGPKGVGGASKAPTPGGTGNVAKPPSTKLMEQTDGESGLPNPDLTISDEKALREYIEAMRGEKDD